MSSQLSRCRIHDNSVIKLFQEGRVELCVIKSHIRKQSLRKLLSSSQVRILHFSPQAPMGYQISLCRIHDNSVSKLFQEGKGGTLCVEVTYQKAISQKDSLVSYVRILLFSPWAPMGSKISLSRFHEKSVSKLLLEA